MGLYNQNAQIRSAPILLDLQNRAFQYGDALFETIRMVGGTIPLLDYHWRRLRHGMQFLGLIIPENWNATFLQSEIHRLTDELLPVRQQQHYRVRLQVYRQSGGFYRPANSTVGFVITATPLPDPKFQLNSPGLRLGLYPQQAILPAPLSNLKTCNSLVYILAGQYAKQQQYDECLLLNAAGQIAEGYYSNVFLKQKDTWLTPPLTAGGVAGTLRAYLLDQANQLGIKAEEASIYPKDINKAKAIWLTNAIRGIQWVKSYKNTTFEQLETATIIGRLNELLIGGLEV